MNWIKDLTGLSAGGVIIVIVFVILTNIPNIILLVNALKSKKVVLKELSDDEKIMREGEKALDDCYHIIIKAIPKEFNLIQKWVVELMACKAFNVGCHKYIKELALRNNFAGMREDIFERYIKEHTPRVLRAVSDTMTEEWEGKENFFPITREEFEKIMYKDSAPACAEIIVKWFKYCRAVKKGEV